MTPCTRERQPEGDREIRSCGVLNSPSTFIHVPHARYCKAWNHKTHGGRETHSTELKLRPVETPTQGGDLNKCPVRPNLKQVSGAPQPLLSSLIPSATLSCPILPHPFALSPMMFVGTKRNVSPNDELGGPSAVLESAAPDIHNEEALFALRSQAQEDANAGTVNDGNKTGPPPAPRGAWVKAVKELVPPPPPPEVQRTILQDKHARTKYKLCRSRTFRCRSRVFSVPSTEIVEADSVCGCAPPLSDLPRITRALIPGSMTRMMRTRATKNVAWCTFLTFLNQPFPPATAFHVPVPSSGSRLLRFLCRSSNGPQRTTRMQRLSRSGALATKAPPHAYPHTRTHMNMNHLLQ